MPLSILSNIASLRAQRQLGQSSELLSRTYERLSSGQRINRASDDAAGLAVAMSLHRDAALAAVAIRNAADGISLVSIGESALTEIGNVLSRMAELAQQSSNGVFTVSQRSPLQAEFSALGSEIERIALTTKFNGINLLSGGASTVLQVGFNSLSTSQITIAGVQGTLRSILLATGSDSSLSYSINASTALDAQAAARTALAAVMTAIDEVSSRRGLLGAAESRLTHSISNLTTTRLNLEAAESRIRDVDVAQDVAQMLRLQIVQQAGAAVLAQSNLQPSLVLKLISSED